MSKIKNSSKAALILLAGWFVFSPAIRGDWLWDDSRYVPQNPALRSAAGLKAIWLAPPGVNYFPVTTTVQWAQWHLWGAATIGYHLTNLGLHLLSCFLLWRLLRRLGVPSAWLGGLLFAVHPLAVESVAWISELKNTLSLPLLLGAMLAYPGLEAGAAEAGRPERSAGRYVLSLLLFLAAMLSKSTVVMFPAVLLLLAWWKRGRVRRADFLASLPFFAVSLGLGLVTVWFERHRAIEAAAVPAAGLLARAGDAGMAIAFYFFKGIFPVGLLPVYPRWSMAPLSPVLLLPWLAGAALLWFCWTRQATWGRHAILGLGFFLLNLAPVLGFVPMAYLDISPVADHFAYVPLLGLVGLAAAALGAGFAPAEAEAPLSRRPRAPTGPGRWVGTAGSVAVLCGLLAVESRRYAKIFLSQKTLWTYTLERNSESWLAHNNLAVVLAGEGRTEEAIGHYHEVLRLKPGYAPAYYNLGLALQAAGQPQQAVVQFMGALKLRPDVAEVWDALGLSVAALGDAPEAVGCYEQALKIRPDYADALNNLGAVLLATGRTEEAIAALARAVRLQPDSPEAHCSLGLALGRAGHGGEAVAELLEALRLRPGYPAAQQALAAWSRRDAPPR